MRTNSKELLAETVLNAWDIFALTLSNKGAYPRIEFRYFFNTVIDYAKSIENDKHIDRRVARLLFGLCEFLELERKRVPTEIMQDAESLECIIFCGYDPYFEGDEPPGF